MANDIGEMIFGKKDQSKRQRTYDGSSIMPGILIGTVTNNFNPLYPDKIEIEIPIGGQLSKILVWAKVMSPAAGDKWGIYYIPEVGDSVIVAFVSGNMGNPFILGCAYQKSASMISDNKSLLNDTKKIKTKAGAEISFENSPTGEKITISTKNKNNIIIDDVANTITIKGHQGENLIKINSASGALEITADESITIGTGEAKIELKKSGSVNIKCKEFKLGDKANITLDGNKVAVEGTQVEMKSAGAVKVKASGPVQIKTDAILEAKGAMVKIN